MKHISESIIGRRGTSGSILQQGDIIITRGGYIYGADGSELFEKNFTSG